MSEKIYRVQMNSKGMPNFSTAEPIVRCKECKYYKSDVMLPNGTKIKCICGMNADDFCSYGERSSE